MKRVLSSRNILVAGALLGLGISSAIADITIQIREGDDFVSPYLYGRNIDGISDGTEEIDSTEQAVFDVMNEAGIRFLRANTGNNSSRYNWRKKLTVHPDWYNNVYSHSWDITAQKVLDKLPNTDAMYAFQLTGYAASSTEYNFADWDFHQAHGEWAKSTLDLAGGGEVADDGKTLVKAGDYSLYNEPWPADSTVGIISHWRDELKYDMKRFQYWSMDNEMEIWSGTHGDLPLNVTGDFLVERYVDVALKAREAWPNVKLTGPVVANEWFWCAISYSDGTSGRIKKEASGENRDYCWLEYFIKKVAAAQKSSGRRLIDVFDMHWYPTETSYEDRVNWHRVFFDTTYNYAGANGIKMVGGSWDDNQTKEYIFKRVNDWLDQYFGKDHGITLGLTETDFIDKTDPMTTAITYASFLGTFMNNGVEIFTPWTWGDGMYEVVHLFSRYGHKYLNHATSSNDSLVSAYATSSAEYDSMTVILVNRSEKEEQKVSLKESVLSYALNNKHPEATVLTLSGLTGETFKSHTDNALKKSTATVDATTGVNTLSLTLPPKSITAVMMNGLRGMGVKAPSVAGAMLFSQDGKWFVNNANGAVRSVQIFDALGARVKSFNQLIRGTVQLTTESLVPGSYIIQMKTSTGVQNQKILLK